MTPAGSRVYLISPNGMLGRAFVRLLEQTKLPYTAGGRPALDITDPARIAARIPEDCSAIVNCAAFTDVDGAEGREAEALQVNRDAVRHLALLCKHRRIPLVHFSTDYVFSGEAGAPYPTDAMQAPINAYGRSKAAGERALWDSGCPQLLIRTSWLYAPWGNNFVRTMARLSLSRPDLNVVNDTRGRPTSAEALAERTLALLDKGERGIFHVTDGGECTWFELTQEIVRRLGRTCEVRPCTSEAFPRPAPRPRYSVLDLAKTEDVLGPSRHFHDNLQDVLSRLDPL